MSGLAISAPPSLSANVQFAIKKIEKITPTRSSKGLYHLSFDLLVFCFCIMWTFENTRDIRYKTLY